MGGRRLRADPGRPGALRPARSPTGSGAGASSRAGLAIFSVASLLCALAPDPTFLNLSRALQGVGGAVMFAVSLALIAQEFPAGRERATAMGIYGATIGVAVAIGPLVGGALTDGPRLAVDLLSQRADRPGGDRDHLREAAREPRPQRDPDRLARRGDASAGALFMLVLALVRGNDEGWGSTLIVSLLAGGGGADGRLRRDREPGQRADAAARALPAALLHRSPAGGIRALGLGLRALPLHRASTCRTTSATRRFEAGLRYLPITVVTFLVAPVAAAPADAGPGAGAAGSRPRDGGRRACC